MSDYYEPYPRLRLSRSIVLAGQLGTGTRLIGRTLCARTGLPFVEVDRQIEHEAGRSLARIAVEEGTERVERWARGVLERIALERPFGVVVLDRAWPSLGVRPLLRRRFDFVHVKRSDEHLRARIQGEVQRAGVWVVGGLEVPLDSERALERLRARRDPILAEAGMLLEAGAQHEHGIASLLLDALEPVAGAQAI